MSYGKETYLNTERLNERYSKENVLTSSVPSARTTGGIRFISEVAHKVRLEILFPSLSGTYKPSFDGKTVASLSVPYFSTEIYAEKGEHIFEFTASGAHGGAILRVSGVGVRRGRLYYEYLGGYYTSSQNVVYMRCGDHNASKMVCENGSITPSALTVQRIDACLHYNKSTGGYSGSLSYILSSNPTQLRVNCGRETSFTVDPMTSVAIADGQGLPTGHDCIVAYTDTSHVLHFCTALRSTSATMSDTTISGVKRVVSAQRGTILLVQSTENVWRAYSFETDGDHSITVGNDDLYYNVYDIVRGEICDPTANYELSTHKKAVFYKNTKDVLVKRYLGESEETVLGYADCYFIGETSVLLVQDNELLIKD